MAKYKFHNEYTLSETAEELGKQAMQLGLIPSLVVRVFPDTRQFYVPGEDQTEPWTPEEAYLRFRKLVEEFSPT
jgi:hypothetical protein